MIAPLLSMLLLAAAPTDPLSSPIGFQVSPPSVER